MRWLTVAGVLLYLTRCNDAGALKCHPGSEDRACVLEEKERSPLQNLIEMDTTSEDSQCLPGSKWERDCHTCICTDSGFADCKIQLACREEQLAAPTPCKPDTTFKRGGSTCVCLENGLGLCTLQPVEKQRISKREIAESPRDHYIVKRSVCKPRSEFNVDCNPCVCAADGLSYSCSHNECLEGGDANKDVEVFMETEGTDHIEQHTVCKPRSTFYVGCNTCRCNFEGSDYSCTNKPCPLPKDVEIFHELKVPKTKHNNTTRVVCIANRMFIKDCNTCWCNEDGTSYFCTRRVCIETNEERDPNEELKLRVVKKECKPYEIFEMDCNMCRCNEDGNSFSCTRRACVEVDDKNSTSRTARATQAGTERQKACQPGQEFQMDCNKCLCDNDGFDFSCTRINCADPNYGSADRTKRDTTTVSQECVPGSVFEQSCNVCRCTTDGLHAACSLKKCNTDVTTTEPSLAFRCTPGDQFRRDCNDCTCSADGKDVFCTLRLCDDVPEISP